MIRFSTLRVLMLVAYKTSKGEICAVSVPLSMPVSMVPASNEEHVKGERVLFLQGYGNQNPPPQVPVPRCRISCTQSGERSRCWDYFYTSALMLLGRVDRDHGADTWIGLIAMGGGSEREAVVTWRRTLLPGGEWWWWWWWWGLCR